MKSTLFVGLALIFPEYRTVLVVIVIQTFVHHEGTEDLGTDT